MSTMHTSIQFAIGCLIGLAISIAVSAIHPNGKPDASHVNLEKICSDRGGVWVTQPNKTPVCLSPDPIWKP